MKKALIPLLFLAGTLYSDLDTTTAIKDTPAGVVIPLSESETKEWTLAYNQMNKENEWILEWVPKGETVENWTRLIQVQFFPYTAMSSKPSAEEFSDVFVRTLRDKFPEIDVSTNSKSEDRVFVDWSLPVAANNEVAQNELMELISTPDGLYRVAFTAKVATLKEETKQQWKEILSSIKLVKNSSTPTAP